MGSDDAGSPQQLHVVLLGYGKGGEVFHAPLIDATPGLQLGAVVTGDPEKAERVRARYPRTEVIASAEELWKRSGAFEIAVVATPNDTHAPLAHAALDAGLSVVVDKPLALTAADGRALAEHAERAGLVCTAFQNRRWDADFLTLFKLVDDGVLGRVHTFESRFERWRPQRKDTWRDNGTGSAGSAGSGVLYDLGPHLVDQAITLFGPVHRVAADLRSLRPAAPESAAGPGLPIDDAFLTLTHRGGTVSRLWAGALTALPGPRFRVLGDAGGFTVAGFDGQEDRLAAGERPGGPDWGVQPEPEWGVVGHGPDVHPVPSERGDYPAFYAGLREAVGEGDPLPVELHEVVHGLEVIEAALLSATEHRAITLPSDRGTPP
ncbi:Gfo/Idh/MocA family oxidoreductase [Nocardiopsis coralliicola]